MKNQSEQLLQTYALQSVFPGSLETAAMLIATSIFRKRTWCQETYALPKTGVRILCVFGTRAKKSELLSQKAPVMSVDFSSLFLAMCCSTACQAVQLCPLFMLLKCASSSCSSSVPFSPQPRPTSVIASVPHAAEWHDVPFPSVQARAAKAPGPKDSLQSPGDHTESRLNVAREAQSSFKVNPAMSFEHCVAWLAAVLACPAIASFSRLYMSSTAHEATLIE